MVRQDKITFLISKFETPELYSSFSVNEFVHNNKFILNSSIDRVLKRIGIIARLENNQSEILTKYIPVNKHQFLRKTLNQFSKDFCTEEMPSCSKCYLDLGCDYYNKKNDWLE